MIYAITHNDLDGLGCAILLEKVYPEIQTFSIDYKELDSILPSVLAKAAGAQVYITDISLNEQQAELCDKYGRVQHIDHHSSSKKLSDKYPWSFTDENNCATYHLFNMLSPYVILQDYREFVDLVDNYDTWGHRTQPSDDAKDLNRLLHMIGPETFSARFSRSASVKLNDAEKAIIATDRFQEEQYHIKALNRTVAAEDKDGNIFLFIASEQYTSSLGNFLLQQFENAEYVVILDCFNDKVSLRGRGNVDLGELAKSCGGGGHKRAAGFQLNNFAINAFLGGAVDEQRERGETRDPNMDR